MKTIKAGPMAKAQFRAGRIARDRAADRRLAAMRYGETSSKILYCPKCGAPVVDSGPGRLAHVIRKAGCREAMGL